MIAWRYAAHSWQAGMQGVRETLVKYGKVGLAVHICLSTVSLVSCYMAVCLQLPVEGVLRRIGLNRASPPDTEGHADVASTAVSTGSTAVIAFLLHKSLFPVRAPITVAATPLVANVLERFRRCRVS